MENIQGLAAMSDEIGTPMKNPTKAVREEKRLAISAFLKDSPSLIKIAKSPIGKLERVYNKNLDITYIKYGVGTNLRHNLQKIGINMYI